MSEEIHEEMAEILTEETQTTETAESSPASEEAQEQTQAEPEETTEEKLARLERENEKLNKGIFKQKKRIDTITAQKYDVEGKYKQELETYQQRLKEYTGEENLSESQDSPSVDSIKQQVRREMMQEEQAKKHQEVVNEMAKDESFMSKFNQRAEYGDNPFVNNPKVDNVLKHVGVSKGIVETILDDDSLCDELGSTEDDYKIMLLIGRAQAKHELANASKEDVPSKLKRIAKKPPAKPSGASGNRADVKNMSVEEYALRRRKRKFGI